ncbi:uncharacterized protein PG986_000466 [Apiospora aurea]|uniref:Uncharacterized protein n=1 Tax=Apiospora aurea TaxID=335848 RepID=A0ABR1QU61_9PEZI
MVRWTWYDRQCDNGAAGNGMPGGASSYTNIDDWRFQERQHPQQLQQHYTTPVQPPMTVHQAAAPKKKAAEPLVAVTSAVAAAGTPTEAARILATVTVAVADAVAPAQPEPDPEPQPERASEKAGRDLVAPLLHLLAKSILRGVHARAVLYGLV